jgi:hypothetical protein
MSESGFSRYFRRSAGQSFSDTVRKLRLAHACQLLENTDEPISTNLPSNRLSEPFPIQSPVPPGIRHHPWPVPPNTQDRELVLAGSNQAQPER